MADELVRVRIKSGNRVRIKNMGRAHAEASDNVEILAGEPVRRGDGSLLGETFGSGRPVKPTTTVSNEAAKKKAAPAASDKAVTEPAEDDKEQDQ